MAFTLPPEPVPLGFYQVRDALRGSVVVNRLLPGDEVLGVGPALPPEPVSEQERADADRVLGLTDSAGIARAPESGGRRHDDLDPGKLAFMRGVGAGLIAGAVLCALGAITVAVLQ